MKLTRIELNHFRQFYGRQALAIAPPGKKNVTLVHAENGVGKTTLLNAVLWTFFEETTKRFEQKDKILNFEAEKEGLRTASVEVTFEHEGNEYLARRTHNLLAGGSSKIKFEVLRVERNGALSAPLPNPDNFINTVIPRAMAPYFFFDGEQAETFSAETNYRAVAGAIRDILGCSLIETAIDDLEYLRKTINKELGKLPGETEIQSLEKEISAFEEAMETRREKIKREQAEVETTQRQLNEVNEKLRGAQAAAELQSEREAKEKELSETSGQIREAQSEIIKWVSTKGIALISDQLTSQSLDFIDEASLRGKIPSPYNEEFVRGLLAAEQCICGGKLLPSSSEWRAVQSLLKDAANAEMMGRVVRARSRIAVLKETASDAPALLASAEQKLARLLDRRRLLETRIAEISTKIEGLPVAEIQQRERARKDLEKRLDSSKQACMRMEIENEREAAEIRHRNDEIGRLASKNKNAQRLLVRRALTESGANLLLSYLKTYEADARKEIERTVNVVLDKTARKHYKLEITDSFELRLLFSDGRPTPKSGGENQLMSLAFIAALVHFAETRSKQTGNELFVPATIAPLVLDSPFGQLDDGYRADTAAFVPQMAPQVILFVSSSQGKQEVLDALSSRIGKEYVLIAENSGPKGEKRQDFIVAGGQRKATTLFNCARNMTRVEQTR